ncbi:MAG: hypothetical protein GX271_10530 [Clostridiales bacterium]|nr:hypothetical protein [Clostridiales bacterium]
MYFEPYKKTYYRFPSTKSVEKMDKRMYFPEKPAHASHETHQEYPHNSYMPEAEYRHDFK